MKIDIDALRARFGAGSEEADIETLLAAFAEAQADVKRLTEQDEDLRESAEIWIRLYQDALDRVETLRSAIADTLTECEACARHAQDGTSGPERTGTTCAQCLKALDALQVAAGHAGSKR